MLAKHITASNDCFSTRKGSANTQIRMVKAKTRPRRRRRAGYLELARVHKVSLWPFGCLLDLREGGKEGGMGRMGRGREREGGGDRGGGGGGGGERGRGKGRKEERKIQGVGD